MNNQEIFEQIINKKFKKSVFTGYDTVDVDKFFDYVIEYLKQSEADVKSFKETAVEIQKENNKLTQTIQELEARVDKQAKIIKQLRDDGYANVALNKKKHDENNKGAK